ncbi:unnamed protein product [Adineta steineri]|uniref:Protein quiver n=1 Tax=Adineta steineri TaxID=433720 RepID=A0A818VH08_9BILA|nr:unnamed protein product [Adineta steineri]
MSVSSQSNNNLTCYSCSDCDNPVNASKMIKVTVPSNQGYYCRKSSILTVVDRDVAQWCGEYDVNGIGLWCCQTNLCNTANSLQSFQFFILMFIMIIKFFFGENNF